MHPLRKVPGIAHQRQQFNTDNMARVQNPLMIDIQPPPPPEATSTKQIQELSISIYTQLAVAQIAINQAIDPRVFEELARNAQSAALAYFEQFQERSNDE